MSNSPIPFPGNRKAHLRRLLSEAEALRFESRHLSEEFTAGRVTSRDFVMRKTQIVSELGVLAQEIHRLTANMPSSPVSPRPRTEDGPGQGGAGDEICL